jgi:hypothetical protein
MIPGNGLGVAPKRDGLRAQDQADADTTVAHGGVDHDVFDEGVDETVPEDVGEADEAFLVTRNAQPRL